jgi:Sortase domain
VSGRHAVTAVALAVVATCGGVVVVDGAGPDPVVGAASAVTVRAVGDTVELPEAKPTATKAPTPKPAPQPAPTPVPKPAPKPQAEAEPAPASPRTQAPGTVRLAEGGTATLVRSEVVDGVLPVPDDLGEATWWGAGPDAASGATVLAGHVNWNGATGPFAELWRAKAGEPVTVVDRTGRVFRFAVTEVLTLDKDELPRNAAELFSQTGPHRLVLVTCGGEWVGGASGYADNRVVIAVRK